MTIMHRIARHAGTGLHLDRYAVGRGGQVIMIRTKKAESRPATPRVVTFDTETLDVMVVRDSAGPWLFRWELRAYGGVCVVRSAEVFRSIPAARASGERALERRRNAPVPS